jgi:hypothetical protein
MARARSILLASFAFVLCACGGGETPPAQSPSSPGGGGGAGSSSSSSSGPSSATSNEFADREQPGEHDPIKMCGEHEKVHKHDLNSESTTEAFVPCARAGGANDYAGLIKVETIPEGVHIVIHATDDQVKIGMLGSDAKTRDAVIVYPRGKGSQSVEVPLVKTSNGYTGDKIVLWDDLGKLTDEGTKLEIAVFDHDGKTGETAEELHVAVAVSTGKSCEKAQEENPQTVDMGKKGSRDLSDAELGAPMKDSSWFSDCGLADSADANICVAVKQGKPLGVSVNVTPANNKVAACIDRRARKLHFPSSDKLDVVHQKF